MALTSRELSASFGVLGSFSKNSSTTLSSASPRFQVDCTINSGTKLSLNRRFRSRVSVNKSSFLTLECFDRDYRFTNLIQRQKGPSVSCRCEHTAEVNLTNDEEPLAQEKFSVQEEKVNSPIKFKAAWLSKALKCIPSHVFTLCSVLGVSLLLTSTLIPSIANASTISLVKPEVTALSALFAGGTVLHSAWTGLAAGWLHTLSAPDHLAALAPLSVGRSRFESAMIGALWGCGHDVGQVLFGALFVLLRERLHLEIMGLWTTRIVGLTLLTIGGLGFLEASAEPETATESVDISDHHDNIGVLAIKKQANVATFATGIIHGLSPDALLIILPAMALPSKVAGASFLIMFLLGTITAMGSYAAFIGGCSDALSQRVPWLNKRLSYAASFVAAAAGVAILLGDSFGVSLFAH